MMLADKIIGRVAATILDDRLDSPTQGQNDQSESAAIFRLDKLAPSQIGAVVREVLGNAKLADRIDIKIPRLLVEGENLPEAVLTLMNAGAVRNAGTAKEALLTANGNEQGLADTLGHVTALGAKELRAYEEAWVEATCHVASLAPTFEDRRVFQSALKGLVSVTDMSLIQLGEFCSKIAEASHPSKGLPIRLAIGWSLPSVDLPRDTAFFGNDKTYGQQVGPWRKAFEKLYQNRSPLLTRQRPNSQPIDPGDMRQRFEENIAAIPDAARVVLEAFINAPAGDKDTAWAVAELEWESDGVHLIFEKPREKLKGLAESTIHFFQHVCAEHDALDTQWLKHLEDLKAREKRSEWNEDDESFFNLHRRYLEQDPKLLSRWEKVIYGKPIECVDFFEGFTSAAHHLIVGSALPKGERFLRITVNKGRKEWRERFNHDVGSYFSAMHRGLKELMGSKVDWKVLKMGTADLPDPLFKYPAYFAKEQSIFKGNTKPVVSIAKASTQIKFEVTLLERKGDKEEVIEKTQLLWMFKPESIGLSLVDDMGRLREKGAVGSTEVPRRLVSKKGGVQSVSLLDTNTLEATFSRDAGSLVPPPAKMKSLRADIKSRIKDLADEGRLTPDQRDTLRAAWDEFETDYIKAMDDFISVGLHGEAVLKQADSFASLLRALAVHARGDVCRSRLVAEILTIGTVRVSGEQPCVIIPPWHPERMKALAVKTRRAAGLVTHMLVGKNVLFGDRGIFFREFAEELAHPFYPEIAVVQRSGAPVLLSESSTVNGYSLLERPVRGEEDMLTDVDPAEAAKQVQELLARYVGLQPHEAANLSVLLYNADAAELPLAVVRELSPIQSESEFQCAVAVRHRDPSKLRRVYAELVTKAGDDPDLPVVSETSENFISKLRIAVVPSSATPSTVNATFKPFDIAFLHDVVSRTAAAEWIPVDWANERPSLEHAPSRWSYRSVSGENELKSTTFLTCPRQTATGWAYVGAVGSVARQTDVIDGQRFLPARRISVQSQALSETLSDAHALAEWVATYDELLDKRQLQANGVTIVRYRRASTNGRNMIVSSTSELPLLSVLTRRRLTELGLAMPPEQLDDLAARIKKDALSVSGDIVLRAAKRGVSAGEMLGLVMSRYLIHSEFKALSNAAPQAFTVFFLLDDYAGWLAQKENRIADILALCVEERDGVPYLHIAVVESKYVAAVGAAEAKKSSRAQLLTTLSTFRAAIFGDPGRLDRDVWLSRLADLLIDADVPPGCSGLLERARSELREGKAKISLRGYSHVFIHSAATGTGGSASEQSLIESDLGVEAWQEVFDRPELRNLVESYAAKADPALVRSKIGPMEPWLALEAKEPAARVTWTAMMDLLAVAVEPMPEVAEGDYPDATPSPEEPPEPAAKPAEPALVHAPVVPATVGGAAAEVADVCSNALADLIATKSAALAGKVDERGAWADEMTRKLKTALNGYGLQAAVLGTRLTPNGCLVRLAGSDKLRVEDIEAKRMQLLTTHAINLVTVQPKPGEIVVTMAGEKRQSVSLWDLWAKREINRNAAGINTSFVVGLQEINGSLLYLNLGGEFGGLSSHDPHSLVAGTTGSGKSVLIQAILLDIAATNPKQLAQIILIDPKMGVDYSALEDLPHMREPIVTTRERATVVLEALVEEMESRYQLFAGARARDLTTFNAKAGAETRLPMLFLVHDEFADWMMDDGYKQAVSAAVQRLGVKARAAGIHLIFAAQRPDKDVMPMQLRENLGNRLILKVASELTSKIALDRAGAEMLLGKGHMAAKLNGEQGLVFAQAPFLSDDDITAAVTAISIDNASKSAHGTT